MVMNEQHLFKLVSVRIKCFPRELTGERTSLKITTEAMEKQFRELEELGEIEVARKRQQFFGIDHTKPEDYLERMIEIDSDRLLICGIRFKNLDPSFPFVEIHPSFRLNLNDIEQIKKILRETFKIFPFLGFTVRNVIDDDVKQSNQPEIWSNYVVGEIERLKEILPKAPLLVLEQPKELYIYQQYLDEYATWRAENLELSHFVKEESEEDLQKALSQHLYFTAHISGQVAGIIAGLPEDYYGFPAVNLIDEFLFKDFRGRGLAAQLQGEFIQRLSDSYRFIWGTIHNKNIPSLKTALKCGRRVFEREYFFAL